MPSMFPYVVENANCRAAGYEVNRAQARLVATKIVGGFRLFDAA